MATAPSDGVDAVEDPDKVLVIRGVNSQVFHEFQRKDGDLVPNCPQASRCDREDWRVWDRETAEVWKEPCRNPECYGDSIYNGAPKQYNDD